MESVEARLTRQFTALDQMISQMQGTSSFLASQLANLPLARSGNDGQ
jgi:flagellar hook-associated protein 2